MDTPNELIAFIPAKEGEVLGLAGGAICRIMEDGSKTSDLTVIYVDSCPRLILVVDNRIGAAEFTIPPNTTRGPPPHWHEMVK